MCLYVCVACSFSAVLHAFDLFCMFQFSTLACSRMAKKHGISHLYRLFSTKKPYNQWLFCGTRIATYGILCIFATLSLLPCYIRFIFSHIRPRFKFTHTFLHTRSPSFLSLFHSLAVLKASLTQTQKNICRFEMRTRQSNRCKVTFTLGT